MEGLTNVKMLNGRLRKGSRMFNHGKRGLHGRGLELAIAVTCEGNPVRAGEVHTKTQRHKEERGCDALRAFVTEKNEEIRYLHGKSRLAGMARPKRREGTGL